MTAEELRSALLAFARGGDRAVLMGIALDAVVDAYERRDAVLEALAGDAVRVLSEQEHGDWTLEQARDQVGRMAQAPTDPG